MTALDLVLDFFLFAYFAAGSSTLGYLFLRIGWPKIRVLDKNYKRGWSFIFGGSFAIVVTAFAVIFGLLPFFGIEFREFLFLFVTISFLLAVTALTIKRKFSRKQKVTVSVPGSFVQAKIVATKAKNKLELDPGLIIVSKPQEVEALKTTLEERRTESLQKLIPKHVKKKQVTVTKKASLKEIIPTKKPEKKVPLQHYAPKKEPETEVRKELSFKESLQKLIQKHAKKKQVQETKKEYPKEPLQKLTQRQEKEKQMETTKKVPLKELIPKKKPHFVKSKKFVGVKTSELFEEKPWPEPKTKSEFEDVKEIERIGQEIEKTHPPEEGLPEEESPLQKLLKEKKRKLKFLKEE